MLINILSNAFMKNYFQIGQLTIYYYAICIVTGLGACAVCSIPLFKKRGIKADYILDIMIAVIPCAIICARLWYVLLSIDEFDSFIEVFQIRNGGLAIHGGVMGGALGLIIVAKIRKLKIGDLFDVGGTLLPLGQAIGRMGNYFNQEVYGRETKISWFPVSVYIENTGKYHYALFFYEMILNLLLLAFLFWFFNKYSGKQKYYSTSLYLMGYGIIRAVLEPLRVPDFQMGSSPIPASVLTSIAFLVIGGCLFAFLLYKDIKNKNYWWKRLFAKSVKQEQVHEYDNLNEGE